MAVSFQCMTKFTTKKKVKKNSIIWVGIYCVLKVLLLRGKTWTRLLKMESNAQGFPNALKSDVYLVH